MKRPRTATVWLALLLPLPLTLPIACEDDQEGLKIACCRIQMVCDNCACLRALAEIGDAGDEEVCELALEDEDNLGGCLEYSSNEALRDCGL
jgi:hypothetical protein